MNLINYIKKLLQRRTDKNSTKALMDRLNNGTYTSADLRRARKMK